MIESMLERENAELRAKVAELDAKLREAYAINARESSLEAERVKNDVSRVISFAAEEYADYETAAYSEDNYDSLKVILLRVFKSMRRQGIIS